MSQPELESAPVNLNIRFADASNLPIFHMNALGINTSSDEFFFTLGVVTLPDQTQAAALREAGYIVAQPGSPACLRLQQSGDRCSESF